METNQQAQVIDKSRAITVIVIELIDLKNNIKVSIISY